jgi:predicted RNA binding protein YcfA (HicA-like mRNA interferase family)
MATWTSREIIKMLIKDNWIQVGQRGSHLQFRHSAKKGRVTVPHPKKDIPEGTVRSIFLQAGWDWSKRKR